MELLLELLLLVVSGAVSLGGIYLAYHFYYKKPESVNEPPRTAVISSTNSPPTATTLMLPTTRSARACGSRPFFADAVDQTGIDGVVNGVGRGVGWVGERTRRLQTGLVGTYALTFSSDWSSSWAIS